MGLSEEYPLLTQEVYDALVKRDKEWRNPARDDVGVDKFLIKGRVVKIDRSTVGRYYFVFIAVQDVLVDNRRLEVGVSSNPDQVKWVASLKQNEYVSVWATRRADRELFDLVEPHLPKLESKKESEKSVGWLHRVFGGKK